MTMRSAFVFAIALLLLPVTSRAPLCFAGSDAAFALVGDPVPASTFIGGSKFEGGFKGMNVAMAADGSVYVAGRTNSSDFPVTVGAYDTTHNGGDDVFVALFDPDLEHLIAATFLGGSKLDGRERGSPFIALDAAGNVYLAGETNSSDFPVTASAFDTTHNGNNDVFLAKLDAGLTTLLASTYLGSDSRDYASTIAIHSDGKIYLSGYTRSAGFPTTLNAYDTTYNGTGGTTFGGDLFVSKLDSDLTTLEASTFLGGSQWELDAPMCLDGAGCVFVAGTTASDDYPTTPGALKELYTPGAGYGAEIVVSKLDGSLSQLLASTYVGGTLDDWGYALTLDPEGHPYVTGHSSSSDYPTMPGAYDETYNGLPGVDVGDDVVVSSLDNNLAVMLASTFIGGQKWDMSNSIRVDSEGNVYLAGQAGSDDFPTTPGAFSPTYNGGAWAWGGEVFVSRFDHGLSQVLASTFLGGKKQDAIGSIALDGSGHVLVSGYTNSNNFPTSLGAFDSTFNGGSINKDGGDGFVTRLDKGLSAALTCDTYLLPESTGGSVSFALSAGKPGINRGYLLLGGVSGTDPGTPLPGGQAVLPLNWDGFTNVVLTFLNTPIFSGFQGMLDSTGRGSAELNAGPVSGFAGTLMYYAFLLDKPFDWASNPVVIEIVP